MNQMANVATFGLSVAHPKRQSRQKGVVGNEKVLEQCVEKIGEKPKMKFFLHFEISRPSLGAPDIVAKKKVERGSPNPKGGYKRKL